MLVQRGLTLVRFIAVISLGAIVLRESCGKSISRIVSKMM